MEKEKEEESSGKKSVIGDRMSHFPCPASVEILRKRRKSVTIVS